MKLNQRVGFGLGAIYILVGLIGLVITDITGFAAPQGDHLFGIFEVNPLHNIVHLLVGALLVTGALSGAAASRLVNVAVGGVYLLVGVVGFLIPADSPANILALNVPDHFLHLGSALVLLAVGAYGYRRAGTAPSDTVRQREHAAR